MKYKKWRLLESEMRSYLIFKLLKDKETDDSYWFPFLFGGFVGMAVLSIFMVLFQSWSGVHPLCPISL